MKIAVVGGGIGGLTLAGLLDKGAHEVTVLEQAASYGEVGAGVLISANGVRVLDQLGLASQMQRYGTVTDNLFFRRWQDNEILMSIPMGNEPEQRWGYPNYTFYRPDVIEMLTGCLVGAELSFDSRVSKIKPISAGVSITLDNGEVQEADMVIGADGTHSVVRECTYGFHPSRYSGYVAYRILIPRDKLDVANDTTNRLGPNGHVVSYFIGEDRRYLNVVFLTEEPEVGEESWTAPGSLTTLRETYSDWSAPLQYLLDRAEDPVVRWELHDREPLTHWQSGVTTLLGDAAHPVVPFMAQGACQAIEDAAVLAKCIEQIDDPVDALARYEAIRKPRTDQVQNGSWDNVTTFHLDDGADQQARDAFYTEITNANVHPLTPLDWLQGYDVLAETI